MKKFITYLAFLFFIFSILLGGFVYKLSVEAKSYSQVINSIDTLNDTYYLCIGLLKENPSEQRIEDCKYIKEKIMTKANEIKENYPFISIYQAIFKN